MVRDFCLNDLEDVKRIHEQSGIDYKFPDLQSSLFLVTKVRVVNGTIRQAGGAYLQAEVYLWTDGSDWGTPEEKLAGIKELDEAVVHELYLKGIDTACLWLPPGMKSFEKRLTEMGFNKDRDGWHTWSKVTK